jgi:hypothetical protein
MCYNDPKGRVVREELHMSDNSTTITVKAGTPIKMCFITYLGGHVEYLDCGPFDVDTEFDVSEVIEQTAEGSLIRIENRDVLKHLDESGKPRVIACEYYI